LHGISLTILCFILGAAIGLALLKTRSYLSVPRNEVRYSEEAAAIQYKSIDEKTLKEFEAAGSDKDIEVGSQFDPTRRDPFSE
jgi:hypothetical protein